jgi:hypothetical protein
MDFIPDTRGTNWTPTNLKTIINWINFAAFMIEGLEESINIFRSKIRFNTILGLVLSTASGTISVAQYSEYVKSTSIASLTLNGIFTVFTFGIAIHTGYIKIYQIQERLELFIKTKQEWTSFVSNLSAELDLPIAIRKDALLLISSYRENYLNLMNVDYEMHASVVKDIETKMKLQIATQEKNKNKPSDSSNKPGQLNIIRKTHGIKVYDMALSEVESMIEFLQNLYKLDSYDHNVEIKTIIESDKQKFMNNAYGKIPIPQVRYAEILDPNTLTNVVVDTKYKIFNNYRLDSIYESLEDNFLERNMFIYKNKIIINFDEHPIDISKKDIDTIIDSLETIYITINKFNTTITKYIDIFTSVCEEITYSTVYMDDLYAKYKNIHDEIMNDTYVPEGNEMCFLTDLHKAQIKRKFLELILEIGSRKNKETFKENYGQIMCRKKSDD